MPFMCQICETVYRFGVCPKCYPPSLRGRKTMYRIRPMCSQCGIKMDVDMIGVTVVEMAHDPPSPYAMISADEHKCRSCGLKVVGVFADNPYSRSHDDDFNSKLWEIAQDNPMKVRVEWEYLPPAGWSEDPVAYLLEWLRTEPIAKSTKED